MSARCAPPRRPGPLYFAECSYGRLGHEFQALDRDNNSREEIVRQIRTGNIDVIRVLEVDEIAGTCRDVTAELIAEACVHRDPPPLDEQLERLRGMLIDHDRNLQKHRVFGW
jgi:hypothetical protein